MMSLPIKYFQSSFPRVMKSINRPTGYLIQRTEDLYQCKEIDVCEEKEKPIASVKEDHSESEAVVLNKTLTEECFHNDKPLNKKCMESGNLKDTRKGIDIHSQHLGGLNNNGTVGNTTTTYKPAHLDQSVSSPKQDDNKSPNLKRKSESGDDIVWTRKVRFKEQMEEHFAQPESYIGSPFKNGEKCMNIEHRSSASGSNGLADDFKSGDNCMENLENHVEDIIAGHRDSYIGFDVIGKGSSTPLTTSPQKSFTSDNGIQKVCAKDEVKLCATTTSLTMKGTSHCDQLPSENPSESGKEKHDSPFADGIPILFPASSPTRPHGNEVDDILYGNCVQSGKRIPQVTISLHEAVCEGLSQKAKSQDRVSLISTLQLESCLPGRRPCEDLRCSKRSGKGRQWCSRRH